MRRLQNSTPSQAMPLLHSASSGELEQRSLASSQLSTEHVMLSSQGFVPGWQLPATHVSAPLQKNPSSQSPSVWQPGFPPPTEELVAPPDTVPVVAPPFALLVVPEPLAVANEPPPPCA